MQKRKYADKLSSALARLKKPTKYSSLLSSIKRDKYLQELNSFTALNGETHLKFLDAKALLDDKTL